MTASPGAPVAENMGRRRTADPLGSRTRPAAVAGHAPHRLHVQRGDVGALLAIDLHTYEALVHQLGGALVLEGLTLHHMTPVAGGGADRNEQRHVALTGQVERARPPGQPVHGVVRVLAQIGRTLRCECVGHCSQGVCARAGTEKLRFIAGQLAGGLSASPARASFTFDRSMSKRRPPSVPLTCALAPMWIVPRAAWEPSTRRLVASRWPSLIGK